MTAVYRGRFERLIAELSADSRIAVERAVIQLPATPAKLAVATRLAGGRLPSGVEPFYRELDGFELAWRHSVDEIRKGDQTDCGYVHLLPVERIFAEWKGVTWFDSFPGGERFRAVKPFDLFQPETCACFLQEEGAAPGDHVALHDFGEGLAATSYTFAEYVERLLISRGFWGWIRTLSADSDETDRESFREKAAVLFPDFQAEAFRPKSGS